LEDTKSVSARLAPEGVNVKEAYQTFKTDPTDSFNVYAGTFGTGRWLQLNLFSADFSRVGQRASKEKTIGIQSRVGEILGISSSGENALTGQTCRVCLD